MKRSNPTTSIVKQRAVAYPFNIWRGKKRHYRRNILNRSDSTKGSPVMEGLHQVGVLKQRGGQARATVFTVMPRLPNSAATATVSVVDGYAVCNLGHRLLP